MVVYIDSVLQQLLNFNSLYSLLYIWIAGERNWEFPLLYLQLVKTILEDLYKTKGVKQNMLEVHLNGKIV